MIDFKELKVWEKAHQLTLEIYRTTSQFPSDEKYGLISQMRRACSSIPTNIAEGCGRDSDAELIRFCNIAMGSASELEYQMILSRDLELFDVSIFQKLYEQLVEVKRMLLAFIRSIKKRL